MEIIKGFTSIKKLLWVTLRSRWKSTLVGIICHDTAHKPFFLGLLEALWRIWGVHTGIYEGAETFTKTLGKGLAHTCGSLCPRHITVRAGLSCQEGVTSWSVGNQVFTRWVNAMLPGTSPIQIVAYTFAQKKKKESHFGVCFILNLKSDISFVMLLCEGKVERKCLEQCPREVPSDHAGGREGGLGKNLTLPRCLSKLQSLMQLYLCSIFWCMSSSFVPGAVLGDGSTLGRVGILDLRKLRNLLLH